LSQVDLRGPVIGFDGPETEAGWRRSFRRRVTAWYARHGRSLPWRETADPYRVWVSEVMLQQTTVAAVVPYYERFLAAFPTVTDLAAASEHDVLRLWEGLGYYSRARNMHATARRIAEDHAGMFPRSAEELVALRGIGRYTAGAIASFAFDEPAGIVEANTIRLYARLIGYRDDPRSSVGQRRLWEFAERIVPRRGAGAFNHALMDLGATICTVREPRCDACPVRQNCRAFALGLQHEMPKAKSRPAVTDVTEAYVVVRNGASCLLRQRRHGERWAGLWDFPRCAIPGDLEPRDLVLPEGKNGQKSLPLEDDISPALREWIERQVAEQTGVRVELGRPFAELRHGVTRFRIRVICFSAERWSGSVNGSQTIRWVPQPDLADLALSRPGRRLADRLNSMP